MLTYDEMIDRQNVNARLVHKLGGRERREDALIKRVRNSAPLAPYSRPVPRVLGGLKFLMSEVPLYL